MYQMFKSFLHTSTFIIFLLSAKIKTEGSFAYKTFSDDSNRTCGIEWSGPRGTEHPRLDGGSQVKETVEVTSRRDGQYQTGRLPFSPSTFDRLGVY